MHGIISACALQGNKHDPKQRTEGGGITPRLVVALHICHGLQHLLPKLLHPALHGLLIHDSDRRRGRRGMRRPGTTCVRGQGRPGARRGVGARRRLGGASILPFLPPRRGRGRSPRTLTVQLANAHAPRAALNLDGCALQASIHLVGGLLLGRLLRLRPSLPALLVPPPLALAARKSLYFCRCLL